MSLMARPVAALTVMTVASAAAGARAAAVETRPATTSRAM
jgi:hypothetical protein